ncbi:MAG: type II secretion system protein GspJ [Spirochaetota bacterium]
MPGKRLPAFTLVELLVALAVLSVIAGLSVTVFASVRRAAERSGEGERLVRETRVFLDRLDAELSAAVYHPEIERTGFSSRRVTAGREDASTLSFATISPQSPYELVRRGEIIRVTYEAEHDPRTGMMTLTRKVQLNTFTLEGQASPVELTVRDDVSSFKIRFENNGRWFDDWDSEVRRGLPDAVELEVTVGGRGYIQRFTPQVAELR